MKKLLIIIVLLSAAVLISPKFIGGIVETEYQSALNKLNENPAITVNSTSFTRNWYSGKVVTEMAILLHHEEISELNITIEDELFFGPVIFTDDGLEFALSYSQSDINFTDLFIGEEVEDFIKNKIHLSTLLTFSKDIHTRILIDEVSKEVDGNNIVSAKAMGEFVLENESRVYGEVNWAGLSAETTDESVVIEDLKISLDQSLIAGDYYQGNAISIGDFDFSIATIHVNDATQNSTFLLSNLLINANSSVNDDLLAIKMNYSADKLVSAGQELAHANLDVAVNGLNIQVMQEVNAFLATLSKKDEEVFSGHNMEKLSLLTTKLLLNEPVIAIKDFSVETPQGKIESNMQVAIDKKRFDSANFMSIIAAIKATANGQAPMAFFTHLGLAPMVEHYVKQGFIVQKEDKLTVNVKYNQGQLNVNGKDIPL